MNRPKRRSARLIEAAKTAAKTSRKRIRYDSINDTDSDEEFRRLTKIDPVEKSFEPDVIEAEDNADIDPGMSNKIEKIIDDLENQIIVHEIFKDTSSLSEYMRGAILTKNVDCWHNIRKSTSCFVYEWVITNYSLKGQVTDLLCQRITLSDSHWSLMLHPEELILVNQNDSRKSFISGNFKIIGKKLNKSVTFNHNFASEKTMTVKNFISYKEIMKSASEFLPNDTLTIFCEFQEMKLLSDSGRNKKDAVKEDYTSSFMTSLFEIPLYYDIEFIIGCSKFIAHKAIIQLRCPKFWDEIKQKVNLKDAKMFYVIEISLIEPMVFHELLRFIYTNEVHKLEHIAESLIVLANEYDLPILKAKCEQFLSSIINSSNVLNLFTLGHKLDAIKLKIKATNFIIMNSHVLTSDEFCTKFLPFMNDSNKQSSSLINTLPARSSETIQESQRFIFHDLSSSAPQFHDFVCENVEVGKNFLDFCFIEDSSKNISLTVLPRQVQDIKWINIEVVVKNEDEAIVYSKHRGTSKFFNESTKITFEELIKASSFKKTQNTFAVYTCVWILKDTDNLTEIIMDDEEDNLDVKADLCKDLNRLFEESFDHDVLIRAENKNFKAHKFMIGLHSKVLNDLFVDHTRKNQRNPCIQVAMDFAPELIQEMLRFFYTGKVHNLYEMAPELLRLTTVLSINSSLKTVCENTLGSIISLSNVLEMLKLADKNNGELLKNKCFSFLQECSKTMQNPLASLDRSAFRTLKFDTLQKLFKIMDIKEDISLH